MKVSSTVEQVFAHAVALEQSGGLRNTIFAIKNRIFILNYDHTVLLRFKLRKSEVPFSQSISFRANDYDSNEFHEEDGKIVFITKNGDYTRIKKCGTPDTTPESVQGIFAEYEEVDMDNFIAITLDKGVIPNLDRNLSHTEFVGKKGKALTLIQRNIYSGSIIEITKGGDDDGLLASDSLLSADIEPIAIKTPDLIALFSFQDVLTFYLPKQGVGDFIKVESIHKQKRDMSGIIACCIYDEIIDVKEATKPGKKEEGGKPSMKRRTK